MSSMSNDELLDAIAAEPPEVVDLSVVRKAAVTLRDNYLVKNDLENQLKEINSRIVNIERNELPDLFSKAKISSLTVEADGNHPAFVAKRETVYNAKIPDEQRQEAFQWFEANGHGDLDKSVIIITFGSVLPSALACYGYIEKANIEYTTNESVHHMTLKAFVKREVTSGHIIPHDLLGVYIFDLNQNQMTQQTERCRLKKDAVYWTADKLFHEILSILEAMSNNAKQRKYKYLVAINYQHVNDPAGRVWVTFIQLISVSLGFLKWQYIIDQNLRLGCQR